MRFQLAFAALLLAATAATAASGELVGVLTHRDGSAVTGATIVVNEAGMVAETDDEGRFRFETIEAGRYSLTVARDLDLLTIPAVSIASGETTELEQEVDWAPPAEGGTGASGD